MGNRVLNATGQDGVADWTGATSVDETTVGAEGRVVIVSSGGSLRSSTTPVAPGQTVEAAGLVAGTSAALVVEFLDGGGSVLQSAAIPVRSAGVGSPRRGIASSFTIARGRLVAPSSTASARLRATATGTVYLLRPWLESTPYGDGRSLWQAGPHTNPDLDLPVWPSALPILAEDGYTLEPIPTRAEFAGDVGVPITRSRSTTRRYKLRGTLALDSEEQDRLEQFFDDRNGAFWFTRPDNMALQRARWLADGEPTFSGLAHGRRRVAFALLLEVA